MYNNILTEPIFTENYYTEYLSQINRYMNVQRSSIFCRYYNINLSSSSYDSTVSSTFDRYNSGIRYDIYDYTPLFYIAQIINDTSDQQDLVGQMFQGNTNIIIYTINTPRVEDIIIFPYSPHSGDEIFRVSNVKTILNTRTTSPSLNWYELTLEYAPIINILKLNVVHQFAYSLISQKYMLVEDFKSMINFMKIMEKHFESIQGSFDNENELYTIIVDTKDIENYTFCINQCEEEDSELFDDNFSNIGNCNTNMCNKITLAPLYINQFIYNFLTDTKQYKTIFHNPKRPFGIKKYSDFCKTDHLVIETGQIINFEPAERTVYEILFDKRLNKLTTVNKNISQSKYQTLDYKFSINIYDLYILIKNWILYLETKSFPKVEDIDYNNKLYLNKDGDLIYDQSRLYEIHKMTL